MLDESCQLPRNTTAKHRGVGNGSKALVGDVNDDVQNPELPALRHLVLNEVERPAGIGLRFHDRRRPDADRTLAALALTYTQPFLPVDWMRLTPEGSPSRRSSMNSRQYTNRRRSLASSLSRSCSSRLGEWRDC